MQKTFNRYPKEMQQTFNRYSKDIQKIFKRYSKDIQQIFKRYSTNIQKISKRNRASTKSNSDFCWFLDPKQIVSFWWFLRVYLNQVFGAYIYVYIYISIWVNFITTEPCSPSLESWLDCGESSPNGPTIQVNVKYYFIYPDTYES